MAADGLGIAEGRGGRDGGRGLGLPLGVSAALHAAALVGLFVARAGDQPAPMPPMYKVDLVAAPPGPRAQGVVSEAAPAATQPDKAPPPRAEVDPVKPAPIVTKKTPPRDPAPPATPSPPGTKPTPGPPQRAGGGEQGGAGTDVANVRTDGIAFPYPGYLQNIVRQMALCFEPPRGTEGLRAVIRFQVLRDGSVSEVAMVTSSRNFRFDNEAKGAVECAATKFGALPGGYRDDVLPIVFSFDPTLR